MRKGLPGASRRSFLNGFLGTTLGALMGAVLYPVVRYLSPPHRPEATTGRVLAGTVSELGSARWKIFPFGQEAGILIETAPGTYKAFSAVCTHLACTVQYDEPGKRILCACHNGVFDLQGRNVSGPPPAPLDSYEVKVVGEEIFVVRS